MKTKQEYTVDIHDLTHMGEGIAKIDGFPVFIPGVLPGERALIRIRQVKKNFGFGNLIRIIHESPQRVDPPCLVYPACGGCQIMHASYAGQMTFKQKRVKDSIERIGGITFPVKPVLGMAHPWRYRNKSQFPVGMSGNRPIIGFYQKGSHAIVDTNECLIQPSVMDKGLQVVRKYLADHTISIYDEKTGKGLFRHVIFREGTATGQVMVIVVLNGNKLPGQERLFNELKKAIPGFCSLVINENRKKTNVIMGPTCHTVHGSSYFEDRIFDLTFRISPHAFFQINHRQTEVLYDQVLQLAHLQGDETVLDLYCGIGTISLLLAKHCKQVIGIETVKEAIEDAQWNARNNELNHAVFMTGAVEKLLPQFAREGKKIDVIVVDPPRKGCDPAVLDAIVQMKPARLVYVSCNPATLARDMKILTQKGFHVGVIQPVDMFCHSSHVECVVLMSSSKKKDPI